MKKWRGSGTGGLGQGAGKGGWDTAVLTQISPSLTPTIKNDNNIIQPNDTVASKELLDQTGIEDNLENGLNELPTLNEYMEQETPELLEQNQNSQEQPNTRWSGEARTRNMQCLTIIL